MNIFKIRDVKTPTRGTNGSAGIDFYIPNEFYIKRGDNLWRVQGGEHAIPPGGSILVPSGIRANVPEGHALIAMNKSGVAVRKNLMVGACVIDEDYTGEIHIDIKNVGRNRSYVKAGEKIIQLLCMPVEYTSVIECDSLEDCFGDKLDESERGEGGFGSTGTTAEDEVDITEETTEGDDTLTDITDDPTPEATETSDTNPTILG